EAVELLALELPEQAAVAGEVAEVEERGARGVVLGGEPIAGAEVAHAVADLDAEVPERVQERLARRLHERVRLALAVEDEQVDVRVGREVAPPVAAEGEERHRRGGPGLPGLRQGALP